MPRTRRCRRPGGSGARPRGRRGHNRVHVHVFGELICDRAQEGEPLSQGQFGRVPASPCRNVVDPRMQAPSRSQQPAGPDRQLPHWGTRPISLIASGPPSDAGKPPTVTMAGQGGRKLPRLAHQCQADIAVRGWLTPPGRGTKTGVLSHVDNSRSSESRHCASPGVPSGPVTREVSVTPSASSPVAIGSSAVQEGLY